jgi:hypothetical protein
VHVISSSRKNIECAGGFLAFDTAYGSGPSCGHLFAVASTLDCNQSRLDCFPHQEATMRDMTMSEILSDPLIRQLMRADRVSLDVFATLLRDTAERVDAQANKSMAAVGRPDDNNNASPKSRGKIMQTEAV